MNKLLHIIILCCFPILLMGQDVKLPFHRILSINDGLPSPVIYDLYASKSGFIFLGTEIGLIRYDGVQFKVFPFKENRGNSIDGIKEDSEGNIWCMNFSNEIFMLKNDTLFPNLELNEQIKPFSPLRGFEIINDEFWIVTDSKTLIGGPAELKILRSRTIEPKYNDFTRIFYFPEDKRVYIMDQVNYYIYDTNKQLKNTITKKYGYAEFTVNNGHLFSVNKSKIATFQSESSNARPLKEFEKNYINKLIAIDHHIWICTNKGLILYDVIAEKVRTHFFNDVRVTDIAKDIEGGYWVSTIGKGLFYIPSMNIDMMQISNYGINKVIKGPNNTLFAGSGNGEIYHLTTKGEIINQTKTDFFTEVEFLFFDELTNRLLSSHGIISLSDYAFKKIRLGKNITTDSYGNYIMSLYNRAIIIPRDLNSEPQLKAFDSKPTELYGDFIPYKTIWNNRTISSLYFDAQKELLVSTAEGLVKFDENGKVYNLLLNEKVVIASDFHQLNDSTVVIATLQSGLLLYKNGELSPLASKKNGLSSNACRKLRKRENSDEIFIITDISIDIYNFETKRVINLSALKSFKNLTLSDLCLINNTAIVATNQGLIKFRIPDKIEVKHPVIADISIYQDEKLIKKSTENRIKGNKNLKIKINAIQFSSLGEYQFEYRLKGYSNTWNKQSARNNEINLFALPSGQFTFELRTITFGEKSNSVLLSFFIEPPTWRKPWFIILSSLFTVSLVYLIFVIIIKRLKAKQSLKEGLLTSQITALRSQMNPHFIYNVLNSLQGLIYTNKKNEASNFITNLSSLMRSTLENSDKLEINIQEEIKSIQVYLELESQRFEDGLTYTIDVKLSENDLFEKIPSMILQPFIENSIKHGLLHKMGDKRIDIVFEKNKRNEMEITISDNGVGRKRSQEINAKRNNHNSFATKAIASRIDLINQLNQMYINYEIIDLTDLENHPIGTQVRINIINKVQF